MCFYPKIMTLLEVTYHKKTQSILKENFKDLILNLLKIYSEYQITRENILTCIQKQCQVIFLYKLSAAKITM